MSDPFAPCSFHEYADYCSLEYSAFEKSWIEFLEEQGGQGGGYSLESTVQAVLEMRSLTLPDVDFDPEGSAFFATCPQKESLVTLASIIRELVSDRALLQSAIHEAKDKGYFE